MERFGKAISRLIKGLSKAVLRFPLTVVFLICTTALSCYIVSIDGEPALFIQKLLFTLLTGSFISVAAQFSLETFWPHARFRWIGYALSILLSLGYYMIISPSDSIDYVVVARTTVAVFSMFCLYIWLPSSQGKYDFNSIALIHLKSAFTSILYAGVLSGGLASVVAAINVLLFKVNNKTYGYMMSVVWILFATIHYLSLLPFFNSAEEPDRTYATEMAGYPRFLGILISYIAVPLITSYTLVLLAYFIKIGITMKWPSGQLGPMILTYSGAGLIIYILCGRLENRFALYYQRLFPKVLIPVVIMQLISAYIRINAYGITESRYYIVLFGIFSITAGIILSFKPVIKNGLVALLAACFSVFSIIPPSDAFNVSRISQTNRLESYLEEAGILRDGNIAPKEDADMDLRLETTSIMNYLERRNYLEGIAWLPSGFKPDRNMKSALGFEPAYPYMGDTSDNFFVHLDTLSPLSIENYDILLQTGTYRAADSGGPLTYDIEIRGLQYRLILEQHSPRETVVSLLNTAGEKLISTGLYDFALSLSEISSMPKEALGAGEMTLNAEENGWKFKIIFQDISIIHDPDQSIRANYNMYILISAPFQ